MAVLSFTLSEEGVTIFHDALACIAKFSEDVSLEARKQKLTLTALNLSKSAYICFTFTSNRFFSRYSFEGNQQYLDRFFCSLYVRALLSVFRARQSGDPSRDRDRGDATIERCDISIEDGPGKKSRLHAKIVCRNRITSSHALPFEVNPPTHAKFNQEEAAHHWKISSRTLRQLMDHFGAGIELLDINTDDENRVANFTCFTEKVARQSANHEEILKKPLHTSIAVDMEEFEEIDVENKLHTIISVKDFRAILQHAQTTFGDLAASYSHPGRPMKLSYTGDGILYDFILMTVGDKDGAVQKGRMAQAGAKKAARPAALAPALASKREASVATTLRNPLPDAAASSGQAAKKQPQPTPAQSRPQTSLFQMRPEPLPPPTAPVRSDSLFVSQNEDGLWDPADPEEEEDEGENAQLEWNAGNQPTASMRMSHHVSMQRELPSHELPGHLPAGMEPTQRLEAVRQFGLFSP